MEWLKSLVLGVVQGITEFLPISSDGHLLITQNLFDWLMGARSSGKENLFFDVILHLGTTVAILVYYRREIATGLRGLRAPRTCPRVSAGRRSSTSASWRRSRRRPWSRWRCSS